jgi:hypothetical protein
MMWTSNFGGPGTGVQVYSKGQVALNALGAIVGDSAVVRAMADYARAWKYKHPSPNDFFFSMNKSLGRDLDWFWYQWFFTTHTFDQAIQSARVAGDEIVLDVRDEGDLAMPLIVRVDWTDGSYSVITYPADLWFDGSRSLMTRIPVKGRTMKSVTLDPDNRFQDLDRSDNVWPR